MRNITSGLLGFGISIACFLPPILHFITGPLGPFIGGFAGGFTRKNRPGSTDIIIIGLILGFCLGFIFLLAGLLLISPQLIATFENFTGFKLPDNIPSQTIILIGVLLLVYGAILGSAGAALGAKMKSDD